MTVGTVSAANQLLHLRVDTNGMINFHFFSNDLSTPAGTFTTGVWHYLSFVYNATAGSKTIYMDGVQVANQASGIAPFIGNTTGNISRWPTGSYNWLGGMDQISIAATPRSVGWIQTEYNNQNSPSSFYSLTDSLTATAINCDSGCDIQNGNSVPCVNVTPLNNPGCETKPDAAKTYTFTANTPGTTYTFSAQAKTLNYTNYNGYAMVQVRVCSVGQGPDGNGECVPDACKNDSIFPNFQATVPTNCTQNADLTCNRPESYVYNQTTNTCVYVPPPVPTLDLDSFKASRVRVGAASTLSWNIPGMANGIVCSIDPIPASGTNSNGTLDWNGAGRPPTYIGSATTVAITQPTRYTLMCINKLHRSACDKERDRQYRSGIPGNLAARAHPKENNRPSPPLPNKRIYKVRVLLFSRLLPGRRILVRPAP